MQAKQVQAKCVFLLVFVGHVPHASVSLGVGLASVILLYARFCPHFSTSTSLPKLFSGNFKGSHLNYVVLVTSNLQWTGHIAYNTHSIAFSILLTATVGTA